ncbi:DUF6216 family protein [Pseudomonas atacamensis]|uniref:DUF6216 family protein n=1 Tax=Pseudomonas atacamensis TaxID=2565368 RepID=UPI002492A132|nr:DUF6216 family protein [Pseudomonas atacamensis]
MDPQVFSDISILVDKWQKIAPIFAAVTIGTYITYICAVTESLSIIRNRLSELVGSKHSFKHEQLRKQQEQEQDLDHFNIKHRLNVRSPYAMHQLIIWADRHGVRLGEIKKARHFFNPSERTFNISQSRFANPLALVTLLFAITLFLAIYLPNAALFKVNKTGQWFWVTKNQAFSFTAYLPKPLNTSDAWIINKGNCLLDHTKAPLSNDWDKKVICYLLLDNHKGHVSKTILEQKLLAWTLSLPMLLVPLAVWQGNRRRRFATELQRRTQKKLGFGANSLPEYAKYYYD